MHNSLFSINGVPAAILVFCGFFALSVSATEVESVLAVDIVQKIRDTRDIKKSGESLKVIAPRNGFATAMAVVQGKNLQALQFAVEKQGDHAGPSVDYWTISFAHRRYAPELPEWRLSQIAKAAERAGEDPGEARARAQRNALPYYDVLLPEVLSQESRHFVLPIEDLLPVVLKVHISESVEPGTYDYLLKLGQHQLEISLSVGAFQVPDRQDYSVYSGYAWSEMNLAKFYDVEPWSEEHWALVERHMELLAGVANKPLVLTVLPENYLSEKHAKIRFRKEEGQYIPDFSLAERYLDLYRKHVGRPDPLILHQWTMPHYGLKSKHSRHAPLPLDEVKCPISVIQEDGTLLVEQVGPPHINREFWTRLMDGVYQLVEARGWPSHCVMLGTPSDRQPRQETVDAWNEIAPDARWAIFGHLHGNFFAPAGDGWAVEATGMQIGHVVTAWAPRLTWPREDGILGGWNLERKDYTSMRNYFHYDKPLWQWRALPDGSCVTGRIPEQPLDEDGISRRNYYNGGRDDPSSGGFARLPFDFWLPDKRSMITLNRDNGNLYKSRDVFPGIVRNNMPWLVYAGPQGPVPTIRYEMLREGLQECEARIAIERALLQYPEKLPRKCAKNA